MNLLMTLETKLLDAQKDMHQVLVNVSALSSYEKTLSLYETNVAIDDKYQKNFTSYYRVRRDAAWLTKYYAFMEENKNNANLKFNDIITYLSTIPHKVKKSSVNPTGFATTIEASFSSKMLATIQPNHPIWDSQVMRFLGIRIPHNLTQEKKLKYIIKIYEQLSLDVGAFINTEKGHNYIKQFDYHFPEYSKFNSYKKIDFYLWNLGKPDIIN